MGAAATALKIGAAVYVGLCVLITVRQGSFVYYPSGEVAATPAMAGLAYESVTLVATDGIKLDAWYVPAPGEGPRCTVLFCHGNGGNIGHRVGSVATFVRLGYNVLIFDYRGYGDSEGKPNEKGTYADVAAAWEHLVQVRGCTPNDIVLFGRSLGGAVAMEQAIQAPPRALVIESSFTSAADMGAEMFTFLPIRLLCRYRYDSLEKISRLQCPVFVAHGTDDQVIGYTHGERLFQAAGEPKAFFRMNGGHNDGGLDVHPEFQRQLRAFIEAAGAGRGEG